MRPLAKGWNGRVSRFKVVRVHGQISYLVVNVPKRVRILNSLLLLYLRASYSAVPKVELASWADLESFCQWRRASLHSGTSL